ncbi:MAG: ATP-binding protein, partial [Mycobacterium sp.]
TERWQVVGVRTNAEVPGPVLRRAFRPSRQAMAPLRSALDSGKLSIRGVDRTLRVAWSLADLGGRTSPNLEDIGTALSFRESAR